LIISSLKAIKSNYINIQQYSKLTIIPVKFGSDQLD